MSEYLKLRKSNCRNCYKCIRSCPVKSIRFDDHQAHIISDECILCGHCFVACPQNAKEIRSDLELAKSLLQGAAPVIASIAPSFVANYEGTTIRSMERALKKLGFSGVEETAVGATIVKKQYEAMVNAGGADVILSSCCHTVNLMIQKYYPKALPYLAHVLSPMQAHGQDIRRRIPDAKTIFIGPCISKKAEADAYPGTMDCVLTFEELSVWLEQEGVELEQDIEQASGDTRARLFPVAGGILRTMTARNPDYAYLAVDGMDNCMQALEDILSGKITKCFIEMSACAGSCVGGPAMNKSRRLPVRDYLSVDRYAGEGDFHVAAYGQGELLKKLPSMVRNPPYVSESALRDTLRAMGKTKPEDELNCGSCGYNTCRDKAVAVILGKATLGMCLPFLKEKAESFSDNIIRNTPNAIIVLNENLEVQQANAAACSFFRLSGPGDVVGQPVVRLLDPAPFFTALESGRNSYDKRAYLADYRRYVDQTIIYDRSYNILIGILRDVTEEAEQQEEKERLARTTVEITDRVIEKQMRTVQEIASLLGETTAETKVALTKLKESLRNE